MGLIFSISANDTDMGEYKGETAAEALDAYARDAGYSSYAAVVAEFGDDAVAVQIDTEALIAAVSKEIDAPVFQDSYGSGVDSVAGVSYPTYQALARSIGRNAWDFKA